MEPRCGCLPVSGRGRAEPRQRGDVGQSPQVSEPQGCLMPISDSELCALIDRQCESAIGAEDFYANQRRVAMEFYMGEAKGELAPPEVEGRSTVVSKDLMETVEWAMPAIMEALTGADDVVSFRAKLPG